MSFLSTQNTNPSYQQLAISKPIVSTVTIQVTNNTQLGFFTNRIINANTPLVTNDLVLAIQIPNVLAGTYIYSIDIPCSAEAGCEIDSTTIELQAGAQIIKIYTDTYPRTSANAFAYQKNVTGIFQNTTTQNFNVYVEAIFGIAGLSIVQANSYFAITRIA